jgi:hypothetical protein
VSLIFHSALRKLNTEPSIGASHQISVHWTKQFQRTFFRNRPTKNKNCLWQPCLLTDRDEMSNLYRGPSIDASYQVSVHLAEGFQWRRLKCEKLTDDRPRTSSYGKSSHCLWQGELKTESKDKSKIVFTMTSLNLNREDMYETTWTLLKTDGELELSWSGRVGSSCSTSGTCLVTLAKKRWEVMNDERPELWLHLELTTTKGTSIFMVICDTDILFRLTKSWWRP